MRSFWMMRRLRKFWLGRRGSTAPGPGCGVLLKKLRSRWLVFDPTYCRSSPMLRAISRCTSKLHWSLRAFGSSRVGEIMSGRPSGLAVPNGFEKDSVGLAGSDVKVVTAASGGLLVRKVNEFIWFGL